MKEIEKLEDILHKEKMDELQREIDELPDYYTSLNDSFSNMCDLLQSPDLKGSKPHLTQTAWRDKYLEPESTLKKYASRRSDLNTLMYAHLTWAGIQILFVLIMLWYISASY